MPNHFRALVLIGRPAAGKSEVIKYLRELPAEQRLLRFHQVARTCATVKIILRIE